MKQSPASIVFKNQQIKYIRAVDDPYKSDIIPGVYEGGYKVWECTLDLLDYMQKYEGEFIGKDVLDLGCGHGLLGIAALRLGCRLCTFQDYNEEVLEKVTMVNVGLNEIQEEKCRYVSGDWNEMREMGKGEQQDGKFDIILGSELIYKEDNYIKISSLCRRLLRKGGFALLANKHYYFGVGGNLPEFKDHLEGVGLNYESCRKINPMKGGNKKQIISITVPN